MKLQNVIGIVNIASIVNVNRRANNMKGTKVIYGYKDLDHAIMCTVKDLIFKGMDILIVAECEGGTITAPVEMFQWMEV